MRRYKTTGTKEFKKAPNKIKPIAFLTEHYFDNRPIKMRTLLKEEDWDLVRSADGNKLKRFLYLEITFGFVFYSYSVRKFFIQKFTTYGKVKREFFRVY
jgi:hypothetical protein